MDPQNLEITEGKSELTFTNLNTYIEGHSPEVGPAQFFILNFLHEKGRILSNTVPAISLVADVFPFFSMKSCSKLNFNDSFRFCWS